MDNRWFGEKFEEKLIKITKSKQKQNQFSLAYNKEKPSLRGQTTTSPFYQALFLKTNKEEVLVVESEDPFSQEQQRPEVRTYQVQSPQQNLEILSPEIYSHIHPGFEGLFPKEFQKFQHKSRLQYFLENWEKLARDPSILNIVKGYQIPFLSFLFRNLLPHLFKWSSQEKVLVDQQIEQMLKKVAIKVAEEDSSLFVSSIFVVPKKDSGHCPVISLKNLNYYIPYSHFKLGYSRWKKETLQEGDYMCKSDLKDAQFSVSLKQKSQKFVNFKWTDLF